MRYRLICKGRWPLESIAYATSLFLSVCSCASQKDDPRERLNERGIAFPFVDHQKNLGVNNEPKTFVIRSAVGATEYAVEIPDAGDGYDIQIPLAGLAPPGASDALAVGARGGKAPNPVATDKELVTSLPSIAKASAAEVATMDTALGVGSSEGPVQSPSYTMGIAKVNQYYRERNFELALMELNNVISFYPNSPKLLKMKGTLLVKTGNHELAMRSWQRALDLAPGDRPLVAAVKRLEERIAATRTSKDQLVDPTKKDVFSPIDPELEKLAH